MRFIHVLLRDLRRLLSYVTALILIAIGAEGLAIEGQSVGATGSDYVFGGVFIAWGLVLFRLTRAGYRGGLWTACGLAVCAAAATATAFALESLHEGTKTFSPIGGSLPCLLWVAGIILIKRGKARHASRNNEQEASEIAWEDRKAPSRLLVKSLPFVPWWGGIVFGAAFVWHVATTQLKLRAFEAVCKDERVPVRFAELEKWHGLMPSTQDATLFVQTVLTNLTASNCARLERLTMRVMKNQSPEVLDQDCLSEVGELLSSNGTALDALAKSPDLTGCRYAMTFDHRTGVDLGHLGPLQSAADLLFLDALFACHKSNDAQAVKSICKMVEWSAPLAKEPSAGLQFARFRCNRLAVEAIERVLTRCHLEEPLLARLGQVLHKAQGNDDITGAYLGELCRGLQADPNKVIDRVLNDGPGGLDDLAATIAKVLVGLTDRQNADKLYYGRTTRAYLKALKNPFPLRLEKAPDSDEVYQYAKRHGYVISAYLLPRQDSLFVQDAFNCARLRIAEAIVAVERYRRANHEKLPLRLDEICPQFIKSLPKDPFDGYTLRYKNDDEGYLVYSDGGRRERRGKTDKSYFGSRMRIKIAPLSARAHELAE